MSFLQILFKVQVGVTHYLESGQVGPSPCLCSLASEPLPVFSAIEGAGRLPRTALPLSQLHCSSIAALGVGREGNSLLLPLQLPSSNHFFVALKLLVCHQPINFRNVLYAYLYFLCYRFHGEPAGSLSFTRKIVSVFCLLTRIYCQSQGRGRK